jgi:hypothetical protein
MKAYGLMRVYIHIFLTSALVGGEWSASRPGLLNPGERAPYTSWIGGWLNPRAGLKELVKRKFLTLPGLELLSLSRPARRQVESRVQIADWCAPWKISNGAENLVLWALQF